MTKREHERAMFEAFLAKEPNFAGEGVKKWEQPRDEKEFPDVICTTASNCRIGVEMGEWLHEAETRAAKSLDRAQEFVLDAVGDQEGENKTEYIYCVLLYPKSKVHIGAAAPIFRSELYKLIGTIDVRWPDERYWHGPLGHQLFDTDLTAYPTLQKHLIRIRFIPAYQGVRGHKIKRRVPSGQNWILLPPRVDTFSDDTMLQPLLALIGEKIAHYGHAGTGFDRLYLLIYYNSALIHNSPVETPRFKFEDAVKATQEFVGDDAKPFNSIMLFIAVDDGRVLKII
jgi:hypothetical protein